MFQIVVGTLLVVALLVLTGYFGWRQIVMLRTTLPQQIGLLPDDRAFLRRQCHRRLFGCVLMFVLAGLLVGMFFIDTKLDQYLAMGEQAREAGETPVVGEADEDFLLSSLMYVFLIMGVVMVLMVVALMDLSAIRKFGLRQRRRLREQRRELIEKEIPQLKRSRNGHA